MIAKNTGTSKKKSIKKYMLVHYIFFLFVPFLILITISLSIVYHHTCKIYGNYLVTNLEAAQERINTIYNQYRDLSTSLYFNKTVDIIEQGLLDQIDSEEVKKELSTLGSSNTKITSIHVNVQEEDIYYGVANMSYESYIKSHSEDILDAKGRMIWFPDAIYSPIPYGTYKYILARALNGKDAEGMALMYMTVDKSVFDNIYKGIQLDRLSSYIIHESGQIIYTSNEREIGTVFDQLDIQELKEKGYRIKKINGRLYLMSSMKSYKTGWTQLLMVPIGSIFDNFKTVIAGIWIVAGIYIIIIFFMFGLINREMVHPIQILTCLMDKFAEGDLTVRTDENQSIQEMYILFRHFNDMAEKVNDLMETNVAIEKEKNNYEMQVRLSQMNPHFIYNSLNTVKWMAIINRQESIRNVTDSLIYLLRQITNKGNGFHSVADEITLIKHYVLIQKTRFMNFDIVYDIEENTNTIWIRKFLLQPIIENSIIHGFGSGDIKNGLIHLSAYLDQDRLKIDISDNGVGFDVNQAEPGGQKGKLHSNIGIKNIEQIILLDYGKDYGLTVESTPGEGTAVHFTLPNRKEQ